MPLFEISLLDWQVINFCQEFNFSPVPGTGDRTCVAISRPRPPPPASNHRGNVAGYELVARLILSVVRSGST